MHYNSTIILFSMSFVLFMVSLCAMFKVMIALSSRGDGRTSVVRSAMTAFITGLAGLFILLGISWHA